MIDQNIYLKMTGIFTFSRRKESTNELRLFICIRNTDSNQYMNAFISIMWLPADLSNLIPIMIKNIMVFVFIMRIVNDRSKYIFKKKKATFTFSRTKESTNEPRLWICIGNTDSNQYMNASFLSCDCRLIYRNDT
jgi:hypothetical protein